MKALVQKVKRSSVSVDGRIVNSIGNGLNVLLGVHNEDTLEDAIKLAKKVLNSGCGRPLSIRTDGG